MTWIFAAYLLGLFYFLANPEKVANKAGFRSAWIWLGMVPIANFVFALFRAGNIRSGGDMALVEIWADGIGWLFLGISLLVLIGALMPGDPEDT